MNDNKLIAEFMGAEPDKKTFMRTGEKVYFYHTSWDWLMPVVQKIEDYLSDNVGKVGYFDDGLVSNDIEVRYQAVVEFIKQHKTYPFNEGDDYWVEEDGDLVWGCWDDVSEEMHDENPNRQYFTEEEVMDHIRAYGVKLYKQ